MLKRVNVLLVFLAIFMLFWLVFNPVKVENKLVFVKKIQARIGPDLDQSHPLIFLSSTSAEFEGGDHLLDFLNSYPNLHCNGPLKREKSFETLFIESVQLFLTNGLKHSTAMTKLSQLPSFLTDVVAAWLY